ncbi:hypothetical protein ACFX1T_043652 [Malus domestica]
MQRGIYKASSEIDTLPCASPPVKDTTPGWRNSTSRENATSTYETDKVSEDNTTLRPYLFALVMDELTRHIQDDIPWCMLFANDIVLIDETQEGVNAKLNL